MKSIKSLKAVLITTGLLGSVIACSPQAHNGVELGTDNTSIIGGVRVEAKDAIAKSTVAIIASVVDQNDQEGQFICTGSLLSDNVVLTAGHCVPVAGEEFKEVSLYVVFTTDLNKMNRNDIRLVTDSVVHPDYNKTSADGSDMHDLALIRFAGEKAEGYELAKFLDDEALLTSGKVVTLAGYGLNETDGKITKSDNTLRKTDVQIYDNFGKNEVILDQTQGKGACHGDSGGPAFIEVAGIQYVWGVTSRGVGQNGVDDCSLVAIYTKIKAETTFVTDALAKLGAK